jgi:hypothetical protein
MLDVGYWILDAGSKILNVIPSRNGIFAVIGKM